MRKNQCKESLDIYIKFLGRTTKLARFLKVAEVQNSISIQGFSATRPGTMLKLAQHVYNISLSRKWTVGKTGLWSVGEILEVSPMFSLMLRGTQAR
jgi:hypothetical protein